MQNLFGDFPRQLHPAARVTWCTYPAMVPAADCLTFRKGLVKSREDCADCIHCSKNLPPPPGAADE